ncbi:PLDc N-terminal domain-containing protein [Cloacibacterium rupense]|uniref:PLDc N-terminal domain-containing protein n=1 Tax=Cloacibacterium rupense TaxID=517423 RepID=UPI001E54A0D3|nr:PLDc N-terminal domain-containing protein [Cloacibacterium rupense]
MVFIFILLPSILWIIALIDILKSNFKEANGKIIWVLLVIFLPILGSILYFAIGKNQKIK